MPTPSARAGQPCSYFRANSAGQCTIHAVYKFTRHFLDEEPSMRSRFLAMAAACILTVAALSQQSNSQQTSSQQSSTPKSQNQKKQPAAQAPEPDNTATKPDSSSEQKPAPQGSFDKEKDKEEHYDMTEAAPVATHHQITVDGKALKYTATAGRLPIKRGDGRIEAEMFYVAYTLDGQDAAKRPLTFAFNGGPGSATIWLHMGALGPKRVVLQPDGFMPPAPYRMEDNPSTLLDKSDLVLIDAIGTGFSRAADTEQFKKFWGLKGDIEAFSEFIRLYITRNERWSSHHLIIGESYGTTRAAGIAGYLADRGISFNGITLLSTAMDLQTLEWAKNNDEPYILLVPSFTMIAAYHHKLAPELTLDLAKTREEVTHWAAIDYALALGKGDALTPAERQQIIDSYARYTGLDKRLIDNANLRIDVTQFTHNLLLDQKLRVGRLDGRFTGVDPGGLLDDRFYDPTGSAILPPYTSMFNNYLRTELNYRVDMPYKVFADEPGFEKWDWGNADQGFPNTTPGLRAAMAKTRT